MLRMVTDVSSGRYPLGDPCGCGGASVWPPRMPIRRMATRLLQNRTLGSPRFRMVPRPWRTSSVSPLVASFDVFDTLLVRTVGAPEDVWTILSKELRLDPRGFVNWRRQAEADTIAAKPEAQDHQFTFFEMVPRLAELGSVGADVARGWLEAEMRLEERLMRPVPGAKERLQSARAAGQRVVYVSDMYLPSTLLAAWLEKHELRRGEEPVYVSCEHGANKVSGRLLQIVARDFNVPPDRIVHLGNSRVADIRGAESAGCQTELFDLGNPTSKERRLSAATLDASGFSGVLSGAAKLTRLQLLAPPTPPEPQLALIESIADVAAPLLVGFVRWLLHRAQQEGIERLSFLSRDGQLLHEIAKVLARRLGLEIPLHYTLGSRRTWSLAALGSRPEWDNRTLSWVLENTKHFSPRSVLRRASVECEEVVAALESAGFPAGDWERQLIGEERDRLRRMILTSPAVRDVIRAKSEEARGLMVDYLEQSDLISKTRLGLVDLGWHGSMQDACGVVLDASGYPHLRLSGYYLGFRRKHPFPRTLDREYGRGFVLDAGSGTRSGTALDGTIPQLGLICETFCSADHGTVVSYRRDEEGRVHAVLDSGFRGDQSAAVREVMRRVTCTFAEVMELDSALVDPDGDVSKVLLENLGHLWLEPTEREAAAWSSFPVDDRAGEDGSRTARLARPFMWKDVWAASRNDLHTLWFSGSMVLTPPARALSMRLACRAADTLAPLWALQGARAPE